MPLGKNKRAYQKNMKWDNCKIYNLNRFIYLYNIAQICLINN